MAFTDGWLARALGRSPVYAPSMHFACERDGIHSRLHIFNYFERLAGLPVDARLEIAVYGEDGSQIGCSADTVPSNHARVVEMRDVVPSMAEFSGTAAVRLVPQMAFKAPATGVDITEYYLSYYTEEGRGDMVHQSGTVERRDVFNEKESPHIIVDDVFDTWIAFQSAYFGRSWIGQHWARPIISLYNWAGAKKVMVLDPIPPRGSKFLRLRDIDTDVPGFLAGHTGSAVFSGINLNRKPFVLIRHRVSGDLTVDHS